MRTLATKGDRRQHHQAGSVRKKFLAVALTCMSLPVMAAETKVRLAIDPGKKTDCYQTWLLRLEDNGSTMRVKGGVLIDEKIPIVNGKWSRDFKMHSPNGYANPWTVRGDNTTHEIFLVGEFCSYHGKY